LLAPSGYALHGLGVQPSICTSGRGEQDEATLMPTAAAVPPGAETAFAEWRRVSVGDFDRRESLRRTCPAERRDNDLETRLARRLLLDRPLYGQVLERAAQPSGVPTSQSASRPGS
jgi:carboxyl-terminal processing protease